MKYIAVAGGSSPSLGRSIVTAIGKTTNTPIIISRTSSSADPPTTKYGAAIRYADYSSHDSLVASLKDVHTVICCIRIADPESSACQLNLLKAAVAAGVKRFAPSEFEYGPLAHGRVALIQPKVPAWEACLASGLEVARFSNGGFMNYLGMGADVGGDEEKEWDVFNGLNDGLFMWDLAKGTAERPVLDEGSPAPRLTVTTIGDVGRFVAAACELENGMWEKDMGIAGDTLGVDEVNALAEEMLGRKLVVKTVTKREYEKKAAEIEGVGKNWEEMWEKMSAEIILLMLEERVGMAIIDPVVNLLCPHVKPTSVREFLTLAWGKK